jgi:hypothetical protein
MASISDRCAAGDIGGNRGAVVLGKRSMPTMDADPPAAAATDKRNHSVNTGANRENLTPSGTPARLSALVTCVFDLFIT